MRRFFIAAALGAPLLIASPALAAVGNSDFDGQTKQSTYSTSSLAPEQITLGVLDRLTPESKAAQSGPVLAHDSNRNGLWWLQVGIGDSWGKDRRRHDHGWHKNRRWNKNHGWHKKHGWNKKHGHKQWSHWDRDRKHRGWDRDRRRGWDDHDRRRHGHRDYDRHRGHRR